MLWPVDRVRHQKDERRSTRGLQRSADDCPREATLAEFLQCLYGLDLGGVVRGSKLARRHHSVADQRREVPRADALGGELMLGQHLLDDPRVLAPWLGRHLLLSGGTDQLPADLADATGVDDPVGAPAVLHDDKALRQVTKRRKAGREAVRRRRVIDIDAAMRQACLALDPFGFRDQARCVGPVEPVRDQEIEIEHPVEPAVDQGTAPAKRHHLLGGALVDRPHKGNRSMPGIHGADESSAGSSPSARTRGERDSGWR